MIGAARVLGLLGLGCIVLVMMLGPLVVDRRTDAAITDFVHTRGLDRVVQTERLSRGIARITIHPERAQGPLAGKRLDAEIDTRVLRDSCFGSPALPWQPSIRLPQGSLAWGQGHVSLGGLCLDLSRTGSLLAVRLDALDIALPGGAGEGAEYRVKEVTLRRSPDPEIGWTLLLNAVLPALPDCAGAGSPLPHELTLRSELLFRDDVDPFATFSTGTDWVDKLVAAFLGARTLHMLQVASDPESLEITLGLDALGRSDLDAAAATFHLNRATAELLERCQLIPRIAREIDGESCGAPTLAWRVDHRAGVHFDCRKLEQRANVLHHPPGDQGDGSIFDYAAACPSGSGECPYTLAVIEFDDDGRMLDGRQSDALLEQLARPDAEPFLLLVFVHGWNESAERLDGGSLDAFQQLVAAIAAFEHQTGRSAARRVLGVYVGWPGRLYEATTVNYVSTFWNRLVAADRLGRPDGDLRELLRRLGDAVRTGNEPRPGNLGSRSAMVTIGHSMGARAVFAATRSALEGQFDNAPARDYFGQLVMLLNPAFSASDYRTIHDVAKRSGAARTPLVLFSSTADYITRTLYPLGQTVRYPGRVQPDIPRSEYATTAPNFAEFVTHRLRLVAVANAGEILHDKSSLLRGYYRIPSRGRAQEFVNYVNARVYLQPSGRGQRPREADLRYRLVMCPHDAAVDDFESDCPEGAPLPERFPSVMVVQVDARILPSHGEIFTAPMIEHALRLVNNRLLGEAKTDR